MIAALGTPGLRLEDVFKKVRAGVRQDSAGRQVPWENASLEVDFFFDPLPHQVVAAPPTAPDPLTLELSFWDSIKASTDPEDFRAYLKRYPNGQFADLAANRLRILTAPAAPAVPAAPPSLAPVAVPPVELPAVVVPQPVVSPAAPPAAALPAPALPPLSMPDTVSPTPSRALLGHTGNAHAIAISINGLFALTASADQSLRQWNLASGHELRRLMGHAGAVTAAALRTRLLGSLTAAVRLLLLLDVLLGRFCCRRLNIGFRLGGRRGGFLSRRRGLVGSQRRARRYREAKSDKNSTNDVLHDDLL